MIRKFVSLYNATKLSSDEVSVNGHPASQLGFDVGHVDRVGVGLLLELTWRQKVGLESGAEVAHADDGIGDGENDEQNGDDGKRGEGLSNGKVILLVSGLVDSDELENEVGQAAEVENDDDDLADLVLPTSEVGSGEQNGDGDWDGSNGQCEFGVVLLSNDDDELNDETEEEEEIELEQRNVDLLELTKNRGLGMWNKPDSVESAFSSGSRRRCS